MHYFPVSISFKLLRNIRHLIGQFMHILRHRKTVPVLYSSLCICEIMHECEAFVLHTHAVMHSDSYNNMIMKPQALGVL